MTVCCLLVKPTGWEIETLQGQNDLTVNSVIHKHWYLAKAYPKLLLIHNMIVSLHNKILQTVGDEVFKWPVLDFHIIYNIDVYTGGIMHYKEGLPKPPVIKKD